MSSRAGRPGAPCTAGGAGNTTDGYRPTQDSTPRRDDSITPTQNFNTNVHSSVSHKSHKVETAHIPPLGAQIRKTWRTRVNVTQGLDALRPGQTLRTPARTLSAPPPTHHAKSQVSFPSTRLSLGCHPIPRNRSLEYPVQVTNFHTCPLHTISLSSPSFKPFLSYPPHFPTVSMTPGLGASPTRMSVYNVPLCRADPTLLQRLTSWKRLA